MNLLLVIVVAILFSAFFSGMEISFATANKLRLEIDKKQNIVFSSLITLYTQNPAQFIATVLIGKNLSLVIYGVTCAQLLAPVLVGYLHANWLVLITEAVAAALIILITAECLPQMLFRINPNGLLRFFAVPIAFFYFLFYPVTKVTLWMAKTILKIFMNRQFKDVNEKVVFSRIDLDHFVNEPDGSSSASDNQEIDNEVKLFRNALDFSKVRLREIMVPRTEIVALDIESTIEELHQKFIETGYSRILFYSKNIDNIVGYIHHSVIFTNPDSIKSNLHKVLFVPETMSASKLLSQFIQQRLSIAIVVDEFGGTSGLVTSEDILEEIFGEIEDEHDTTDLIKKQVAPDEYVFSGRIELDELRESFHLDFPENDNFETLAGYILFNYESIPKTNTQINIGQYRFKILKASNTKIELVHLKMLDSN